jgi:hypothetical protein
MFYLYQQLHKEIGFDLLTLAIIYPYYESSERGTDAPLSDAWAE